MSFSERPWVRATASLGANLMRGAVSFTTGLVVARTLGAARFGELAFLLGTFSALALLLDAGTTSAFYTMLASRRRGPRFFIVYVIWTVGVQFVVTALAIWLLLPEGALQRIWLGVDRPIVLLSLASSFVTTQVWTTVTQMAEAVRKTVFIQAISTIQVLLHLAIVIAAISLDELSIALLLALPIVEYLLLTIVLVPSLLRANMHKDGEAGAETFAGVVGEYWRYCRPLVLYSFVGFSFQFADRWLLQQFGGATQQGFFAIGQQFASIASLVTVSILAVIWKEVAESFGRNDLVRVRHLFVRARHAVFFCGAAVSAMLVPYVGLLLRMTVGTEYVAAILCVSLMFFYPIQQAVSQLQQTFLLATGATSAYSIIGIVLMLISIPLSYVVMASPAAHPPGLGLGAVGLAVKFLLLQLAGVIAQFWFLHRQYGFESSMAYDVTVLVALFGASWTAKKLVEAVAHVGGLGEHPPAAAAVGACLYVAGVTLALVRWPALAGVTLHDRDSALRVMRRLIRQRAV